MKKKRPQAFTIDTPKVYQYAVWVATPDEMREEDEKTAQAYLKKHKIKSTTSLGNYAKIDGFEEIVYKLRMRWRAFYLNVADKALLTRARGCTLLKRKYKGMDAGGNPILVGMESDELEASVHAAETLHRVYGDLTKKEAAAGAQLIIAAAEALDKREGKKS